MIRIKIDERNDAVFQEVIRTKKALLIPDVFADDRPNHEVCRNFGIKGIFMLPLVSMGDVLGVNSCCEFEEKSSFIRKHDHSWHNRL